MQTNKIIIMAAGKTLIVNIHIVALIMSIHVIVISLVGHLFVEHIMFKTPSSTDLAYRESVSLMS